jgi:hypothetical protein
LLALTWVDVDDFEASKLRFRRSLSWAKLRASLLDTLDTHDVGPGS